MLMHHASTILDDVKVWLTIEAEPLVLSNASSQQGTRERIHYPEILSEVLDSVANTALLTIEKILCCHARQRSSSLAKRSGQQHSLLLNDQEIIEQWRQRATAAFKFVQGESTRAAKPLDFGLRQLSLVVRTPRSTF